MKTLDARQRAMLLDMGVRVWPTPHAQAGAMARPNPAAATHPTVEATPAPHEEPPARALRAAPAPHPLRSQDRGATATTHWQVQAPRLLYPEADPSLAPPALGAGWLVVAEAFAAGDGAAQAAERLLGNMLHALQLHHHPRVALCSVHQADPSAANGSESDAATAIAYHVETFAPSVVLVMGRGAVRAALARSEPLGKLRGAALAIAGVPVVVTFGPHFLLRSPESKSAAWADLCRARALAGPGVATPMP